MKRNNSSQTVYKKFVNDFLNNKIDFGEKITESSLAEKYKVSRTPLREAIKVLEQEGIITRLSNGRITVVEVTPENIDEVFKVRLALENMLLEQTINNPTLLAKLEKSVSKSKVLFESNKLDLARKEVANFTTILYGILTMDITINLLRSYNILLQKFKYASILSSKRIEIAIEEHSQLCKAVKDGDLDLIRKINTNHLLSGSAEIKNKYFNDK